MNKLKLYMLTLYTAAVIQLGGLGYIAHNHIKDKEISDKAMKMLGRGLEASLTFSMIGACGVGAESQKKLREK